MAEYQWTRFGSVIRAADGATIPVDAGNTDYQRFQAWCASGGVPDPADLPSVVYAGRQDLDYRVQTTGTTPGELLRLPLTTTTVYTALVLLHAIDAGNGVVKSWYFKSDFKRLNGGAQAVGARQDIVPATADGGAPGTTAGVASWAITPALDGNDAVISVTGAAGRTIDWFAFVTLRRFRPAGL